jgi:hypothetical protein
VHSGGFDNSIDHSHHLHRQDIPTAFNTLLQGRSAAQSDHGRRTKSSTRPTPSAFGVIASLKFQETLISRAEPQSVFSFQQVERSAAAPITAGESQVRAGATVTFAIAN